MYFVAKLGREDSETLIQPQRCTRCSNSSIYNRAYSGEALCGSCFCSSIEEKVKRAISKYGLLKHGDKVGVAVSGGKDSLTLLRILSEMCRHHASKIFAITIDEGISSYREEAIDLCKEFTGELDIPHCVVSFKELYGFSLDNVIKSRRVQGASACSICGILRRRAIDIAARSLGVDVIATAHNLDDMLQTFMINLLNGDMARVKWFDSAIKPKEEFVVRRVRPLMDIYEKEIAMYAFLKNTPFQTVSCPYMNEGIRSEIRSMLNALEEEHPGIKYSTLNSAIRISKSIAIDGRELKLCKMCNFPSSGELCSVCKTIEMVKGNMYI
ncbi:MAG: TIGR00269 family protein [Nitrososphaerales archaeon]|nr:TIGR00269 family protein [Nitrososphaerales archaeon]